MDTSAHPFFTSREMKITKIRTHVINIHRDMVMNGNKYEFNYNSYLLSTIRKKYFVIDDAMEYFDMTTNAHFSVTFSEI